MEQHSEQKIGGKSVRITYDATDPGWTAIAKTLGMSTKRVIQIATGVAMDKSGSRRND